MDNKSRSLAVIGVGNMAKAIIHGIIKANIDISEIFLYDNNDSQYGDLKELNYKFKYAKSISEAILSADCVLLSVKPQNYGDVLSEISKVKNCGEKLYISIGAGITSDSVSNALNNAAVIRVLPNVPMLIGKGVSVICKAPQVLSDDFAFVCSIFESAGSILLIDEAEMNRIIGVTSSSPAYVFKFINAIYQGALSQGLCSDALLDSICDMVIGSAQLLKDSSDTPEKLISRVASKGGTTEQALLKLDEHNFDAIIEDAMKACTMRADELGKNK